MSEDLFPYATIPRRKTPREPLDKLKCVLCNQEQDSNTIDHQCTMREMSKDCVLVNSKKRGFNNNTYSGL